MKAPTVQCYRVCRRLVDRSLEPAGPRAPVRRGHRAKAQTASSHVPVARRNGLVITTAHVCPASRFLGARAFVASSRVDQQAHILTCEAPPGLAVLYEVDDRKEVTHVASSSTGRDSRALNQ